MGNSTVSGLSCSLEQPLYFFIPQLATKCLHTSKTESDNEEWCRFWTLLLSGTALYFFITQFATKCLHASKTESGNGEW